MRSPTRRRAHRLRRRSISSHTEAGRRSGSPTSYTCRATVAGRLNESSTADGRVSVSEPSDPLEREADLTASEVISARTVPADHGPACRRPLPPGVVPRRGASPRFGGAASRPQRIALCYRLIGVDGRAIEYEFADTGCGRVKLRAFAHWPATLSADEALEIDGLANGRATPPGGTESGSSCAR